MLLPPTRPFSPAHQRLLSLPSYPSQAHWRHSRRRYLDQSDKAIVDEAPAFSSFLILPPEVRIKIWKSALLPRLITITPKFDWEATTCEVKVEAPRVELLYVCQESRAEALRTYSQIRFNGDSGGTTFISWPRDTIFLDLPDDPRGVDVDDTMGFLGITFRSVQVLAIRLRTHVFWGFPDFLRGARDLQKLTFVDELERESLPRNVNGYLYLIDLGSLGFVRGYNVDPYREHQYFQEDIWITLLECYGNEQFDERQWEMSPKTISWLRNLHESGERYCLLLPVTCCTGRPDFLAE